MLDIRKDFPNLEEKNRGKTLVYLDSAATSLTPKQVINSESEYYEKFGGSIHRSVYELGEKATNAEPDFNVCCTNPNSGLLTDKEYSD